MQENLALALPEAIHFDKEIINPFTLIYQSIRIRHLNADQSKHCKATYSMSISVVNYMCVDTDVY